MSKDSLSILSSENSVPYFSLPDNECKTVLLPPKFTFPFYYEPHPLCLSAAADLQKYLNNQTEWEHNFGHIPGKKGVVNGKMFGVLVVLNNRDELGYLSAFSGKLAGRNNHSRFVPPVFDTLLEEGFFKKEEEILIKMNREIEALENSEEPKQLNTLLIIESERERVFLREEKAKLKLAKEHRDKRAEEAQLILTEEEFISFREELNKESIRLKTAFKRNADSIKKKIAEISHKIELHKESVHQFKEERKNKSVTLQQQLFDAYYFLNSQGEKKSLSEIFENSAGLKPPAGAGECAAPKLLQHAFLKGYKPIAMAEFWWGQSPVSEIRVHGHFYPACRGKCEPILGHMLNGIPTDDNPMLNNPAEGKDISVVFEDEYLLVINKPAEFLSVPGKNISDSVYLRVKQKFPYASGPLLVHRLDQSTSGLMLIAKTKEIHKELQSQFIQRKIKKRYVALLDGVVNNDQGIIDLPLRVDLNDRPRQLVCFDHGKSARTLWEVIERKENQTRLYFFPVTGRTHQLRIHAAHKQGLGCPIIGDDLYGKSDKRLHLHAERLEFYHPFTRQILTVEIAPDF